MSAVRDRKRKMVSGVIDAHLAELQEDGAEFIIASGLHRSPRLGSHSARWNNRRLRGANVIIGTGTRAALEPIPGLAEAQPLTHVEALELDEIPEHLLVIGGATSD